MAVVAPTFPNKNGIGLVVNDSMLANWILANGDVGGAVKVGGYSDKSTQFTETFGAGGSVTLRGSLLIDPDESTAAHWFDLSDVAGDPLTFAAAGGKTVLDHTLWVSPIVTAGDGSTSILCSLFAKKGN